ncbi:hypothetical protein L228DRAFT_98394 [Xylona heveae TC161]|uniref:C2H2-type domain-containing protein n=1 Tax=Xylona heveae (strain CBS 132557 / TC161) TaxID=1328760 RepID=A0A165I7Y5_XYLHT|nr:hypothetical protein L228DRAFT_98394 [Xylona heveae TC161]KZF24518.1 hypothetical protein L228DRAFT_98394 [Xylona heveae TC161]
MGKKKRGHPDVEEILSRPWCYYCERDFDDLKILISHQKAKHFKCERCGRRLNTAGGLSVHMNQVHKENLGAVENALPNRTGTDVEIFGMEGIPEDVLGTHNQRILSQFHQAEADRRAVTGNPAPGTAGSAPKKPKFESPSDIKKRLAEHKARKAAEASGQTSSGDVTPTPAETGSQSPVVGQSVPAGFPQAGAPFMQQTPPQPSGMQANPSFPNFPQQYGDTVASAPAFQQGQPPFVQQPGYGPPGMQPFPGQPGFNAASPTLPYQQPLPSVTPPQPSGLPQPRPGSLPPTAPGLPQRPSFSAPHFNPSQMQQMHHGVPLHQKGATPVGPPGASPQQTANGQYPQTVPSPATATQPPVSGSAEGQAKAAEGKPAEGEKKAKKEKASKLVYSDNEVSPEEKMAKLPRYAFVPDNKEETVLGSAVEATVTGVVDDQDEVTDEHI